ncbi:hypothetical protein L202_03583 [Cryptococcus amylolentus CBS 6039]|uniref:Transcriptional adapter 3 n=1 Tax=Cryptococcus amylolentus CBS 6039 TaxID=1295533 RepID=A0A1E3HVM7_9TREE|nr:hypothetical protein L202_03583 [Cryptococcus amylolentus CBS 6039]ODN79641.1 hypothetical protein L202_03583 [Cryptococcus amylolentus CBS 6039]
MTRSIPKPLIPLLNPTSYPSLPPLADLETIRSALLDYSSLIPSSSSSQAQAQAQAGVEELRKSKKRKEREEEERAESERLARENGEREREREGERERERVEALERSKMMGQQGGKKKGLMGVGGKGSPGVKVKRERTSLSPAPSNASTSSFKPPMSQPHTYASSQTKKKKIKRVIDSDDETPSIPLSQTQSHSGSNRPVQPSPPKTTPTTSGLKLKLSHPQAKRPVDYSPAPAPPTGPGAHIDFSLPPAPSRPLIPHRSGPREAPKPGPKKQSEVDDDYSNKKAPNQVAFPTFWSFVEPYLRDVREDDLAMLGFKTDPPEAYHVPNRGRHYTEVWDEEDGNPPGTRTRMGVPNLRQQQLAQMRKAGGLNQPHFVPSAEMRDENLVDEQRGLGALTERVVAAVVGTTVDREKERERQRREKEDGGVEDSGLEPARVDVLDLEERMKKELRAVMLLGEHEDFDPNNRDDDEVSSALRQCQRLLAHQTSLNDARKARLVELSKQRLAYTEYRAALDGIEKSIEEAWAKRIKKYGLSPKKHPHPPTVEGSYGTIIGEHGEVVHLNASGRPPVPDSLKRLVETRKGWIGSVGQVIKERPRGELVGIPGSSVFEGVGTDKNDDAKETSQESV